MAKAQRIKQVGITHQVVTMTDCFLAKFPPLVGIHVLSLEAWAKQRCKQVSFKHYPTYTVMGGIMYTPPEYSKLYNSFAMMLGRRKIPRGQRSEQGRFRLVDWDEYEAMVGTSSLLTTRRAALAKEKAAEKAKEKADRIRRACEKLALLLAVQLREPFEALAEPVRRKRRLE